MDNIKKPESAESKNEPSYDYDEEENDSESFEEGATAVENLRRVHGARKFGQSPDNELLKKYEFQQSWSHLSSVPEEVLEMVNLKNLNLSFNKIAVLPDEITKLTYLQSLDLSHNQLTTLPNSFIETPCLKYLNISHNKFNHIPRALYYSLPCLRFFDISYNCVDTFIRAPLCANYLEVLLLGSNELNTIPRWIFDLTRLRVVDLSNNILINIPGNFLHEQVIVHLSRSIKVLNLQNCQLNNDKLSFASSILDLETLILSNTFDVDDEHRNSLQLLNANIIGRATNLKHLLASNVDLFFLHQNFDSLQNIQYLDLSHNGLGWLPSTFCNLLSLSECKLNSNGITQLPNDFGKLINLKKLFLNDNNIVKLPMSFLELPSLEYCDLYNNRLQHVDIRIIGIETLKGIDLESNCLNLKTICSNGEESEKFYQAYRALRDQFRKDMELERPDEEGPKTEKAEASKIDEIQIPDFIANYYSSEIYSIKTEPNMENWDRSSLRAMFSNDDDDEYDLESETPPESEPGRPVCKYCHSVHPEPNEMSRRGPRSRFFRENSDSD